MKYNKYIILLFLFFMDILVSPLRAINIIPNNGLVKMWRQTCHYSNGEAGFYGYQNSDSDTLIGNNVYRIFLVHRIGPSKGMGYTYVPDFEAGLYTILGKQMRCDGVTSIQEVPFNDKVSRTSSIYDLNGRRLSEKPQRGIYIQDGKKRK